MLKKIFLLVFFSILIAGCQKKEKTEGQIPIEGSPAEMPTEISQERTMLTIREHDRIFHYDIPWQENMTGLEAVKNVCEEQSLNCQFEEGEEGTKITQIREWTNTEDLTWQYQINSFKPSVALDRVTLQKGDILELSYQ